jgi:phage shock protein PspC (stress-responsive transcriptional regulator)
MAAANPAKAISIAGLTCGALDISAALVVYGLMGSKPLRLLQGIAGGILGPRTYSGGTSTALLGLALHFVIAFGAATVFFLASRVVPLLLNHAVVSGVLYGIAVYFFMNRVVVQLSAATKFPFSIKMMLIGVIIHIFCVGIPISLSIRRYAR